MKLLIEQCDLGPRYPESEGALLMKQYLQNFLRPISDSLYVMDEKIPHPYKITVSENLRKIDNEWKSYNTGFTLGKYKYVLSLDSVTPGNPDI